MRTPLQGWGDTYEGYRVQLARPLLSRAGQQPVLDDGPLRTNRLGVLVEAAEALGPPCRRVAAQYVASFGSLELDDAMSVSVISVMACSAPSSIMASSLPRFVE